MTSRRGSALVMTVMLSGIVLLVITGVFTYERHVQKVRSAGVTMDLQLMGGHSMASLVKQEIQTNYAAFLAAPAWASCRGSGTLENFLSVLANPSDNAATNPNKASNPPACASVNFTLAFLKTSNGATQVPLSAFMTTTLVPVTPLGNFQASFRPGEIDGARHRFVATILSGAAPGSRGLASNRGTRAVMDVKRVVDPAGEDTTCRICIATPGAICCDGTVRFTYLVAGTGQMLDLDYDENLRSGDISPNAAVPNPAAVSIKGIPSSRIDYGIHGFCLGGYWQPNFVDAAAGPAGDYYLTSLGDVWKGGVKVSGLPALVSIAYDDEFSRWLLLMSDGSVQRANDIEDLSNPHRVGGLHIPNAERIVTGAGPAIGPPCT